MVGNFHPTPRAGMKHPFVEHPLRNSTKMVNLVPRYTILVNPNLVDLERLGNFLWTTAIFGESGASGALPNMPIVSNQDPFIGYTDG